MQCRIVGARELDGAAVFTLELIEVAPPKTRLQLFAMGRDRAVIGSALHEQSSPFESGQWVEVSMPVQLADVASLRLQVV
jgi:hypothetical protein